ncbi:MAG: crossover junction endodeoxyribonuclease RuvC [Candidatus Omnitrophica bacterium]|jgi:crossover junction endodeoxyribonuclease RuvC|nr:crossover junction endodeoxyribonuclease RuvC [Candidatus Omnitrophota bacterium]
MVILGIDPAINTTGYGVIDFGKNSLRLLEAGVITTSGKNDIASRLGKIYSEVSALIKETNPKIMVLEKIYSHYQYPTISYMLGQARGVICLACSTCRITMVEYAATRVKKAIVGNGLASKHQVQHMIANILGIKDLPKYTDVTDALGLAVAHCYISKRVL